MSSLQQRCDFMMNVARHALIMGIKLDEFQKLAIAAYGVLESPTQETVPAPEASIVKAFERSPRRVQETSPMQSVCDRAAHLTDVPTPLKRRTNRCACGVSPLNHCNLCD